MSNGAHLNPTTPEGLTCEDGFDLDEYDDELGSRYCYECGGRGWIIRCPDDLCHGQGECIHGDPPRRCWVCNRDGEKEDYF